MGSPVLADKRVLGLESAGTLMTPREFDAIVDWDENYRYELIHGVLVVAALPLPMETGPNETLGVWLANYQMQGGVLDGTLPEQYVRTIDSRRRADRLIWVGLGRYPNVKKDLAHHRRRIRVGFKEGLAARLRRKEKRVHGPGRR
jgi:hypothetical protein